MYRYQFLILLILISCGKQPMSQLPIAGQVIYGTDNRQDISSNTPYQTFAPAIAMQVESGLLIEEKDNYSFVANTLQQAHNLCVNENFGQQNILGECTGFLVKKDILVTAGHCMTQDLDCAGKVWIFNYTKKEAKQLSIPKQQVYNCLKVLASKVDEKTGLDFAIIQLDRAVDATPLEISSSTSPPPHTPLFMLGYPNGLPLKITTDATVLSNNIQQPFFNANLDSFHGNSGSPVFNATTNQVEGILVRGEKDFTDQGTCQIVHHCTAEDCSGEAVTKLSQINLDYYLSTTFKQQLKLSQAALQDNTDTVKALINSGVDINTQSPLTHQTSIMLAIENDNHALVQFLLSRPNIDFSLQDSLGETLITKLYFFSDEEFYYNQLIQLLLSHPELIYLPDSNGDDLLLKIVQEGNITLLQTLLKLFPRLKLNYVSAGWSPLLYAVFFNHIEITKLLLAQPSISPSVVGIEGQTPLHMIAFDGTEEMLQLFLSLPSIDINASTIKGETPLMLAAENNNTQIYEILANQPHIDFMQTDSVGNNIAHYAVKYHRLDIIKDLIARHFNFTLTNQQQLTPLDLANFNKDTLMINLLKSWSAQ